MGLPFVLEREPLLEGFETREALGASGSEPFVACGKRSMSRR
jgi:hypothetical protein